MGTRTSTIASTIAEGAFYATSVVVALFVYLLLSGKFADDYMHETYVRRWNGGCGGWTNGTVLLWVQGELEWWYAYVTIAVVLARLHPIMTRVPQSKPAIVLACIFFVMCGGAHLLNAYAAFHPIYDTIIFYIQIGGKVSLAGAFFIAYALVKAFAVVIAERKELEQLKASRKEL